jgi:hypothetical protein
MDAFIKSNFMDEMSHTRITSTFHKGRLIRRHWPKVWSPLLTPSIPCSVECQWVSTLQDYVAKPRCADNGMTG